jgi:NADH dehydrogenase
MAAQSVANLRAHLAGKPGRAFVLAYQGRFISLGRRDALAQFTNTHDAPLRWFVTGRLAALIKESTFAFNLFGLKTGFYPWQVMRLTAPSLPASTPPKQLTG